MKKIFAVILTACATAVLSKPFTYFTECENKYYNCIIAGGGINEAQCWDAYLNCRNQPAVSNQQED